MYHLSKWPLLILLKRKENEHKFWDTLYFKQIKDLQMPDTAGVTDKKVRAIGKDFGI